MNLRAWIAALRNALTPNVVFLIALLLVIFALRKIKIRRPRRDTEWDDFEEDETQFDEADEETLSGGTETPSRERDKGQRGEDLIADILCGTVTGEFALFRNVYVPNKGKTSEIDLLMVHEKGLFVFESKNYNGLISGSMDAMNWVHIHPNRKKYLFYNPVRQNRTHIRALSRYLDIPERFFLSYIVFSDRCALERVPDNTRSVVIAQTGQLAEQLEDTLSALPPLYGAEELREIADRLEPLTDVDADAKAKHIADIRDAQESTTCPFCGSELVMRRGKYGAFWGCSSYPKCKFKRKIEG